MLNILTKIFKPDPEIRNYSLYIIPLEDNKYYVGLTSRDPKKRVREHGTRKGAAWARKYKPLRPIGALEIRPLGKISKLEAQNRENDFTHECMGRFGRQNVRGGRMTSTSRLLLRQYNPGTPQDLIQILLPIIGLFVLILVLHLMLPIQR